MAQVHRIFVKGMVCSRCIALLRQKLEASGITVLTIGLGKLELLDHPHVSLSRLNEITSSLGFDVLVDKETKSVMEIKQLVEIYLSDPEPKLKFSAILREQLRGNYDQLSALFRRREGITVEAYLIQRRIDRVKELLRSDKFSLTEISYRLGYSSVHHLSRQFKDLVGINPSHYKENTQHKMM